VGFLFRLAELLIVILPLAGVVVGAMRVFATASSGLPALRVCCASRRTLPQRHWNASRPMI
jgi:hypothetical protein